MDKSLFPFLTLFSIFVAVFFFGSFEVPKGTEARFNTSSGLSLDGSAATVNGRMKHGEKYGNTEEPAAGQVSGSDTEQPDSYCADDDVGITRIPEPSTLLLLGFGSLGLAGFFRKRKSS